MSPKINDIIAAIECFAPRIYQESYDNSGLLVGDRKALCTGALLTLDCTPDVVREAVSKKCNLIVAHHPIVFTGLKQFTSANYVQETVELAIKNDVAIYAAHTNLDNVRHGVNAKIAEKMGLVNCQILQPKVNTLQQLICFVPQTHADALRLALFEAGAGEIGNYSQCSFNSLGEGSFLGNEFANPKLGERLKLEFVNEVQIQVLLPIDKTNDVLRAMKQAHPYEEVAYFLVPIKNANQDIGSGLVGDLPEPLSEGDFLQQLKENLKTECIRYTALLNQKIHRVALCGGSGFFLLPAAKRSGAQVFVTGDVKYHEFFDAENQIVIADVGHYESEQFTPEIFNEIIVKKFPNFAIHFSGIKTNPINYF